MLDRNVHAPIQTKRVSRRDAKYPMWTFVSTVKNKENCANTIACLEWAGTVLFIGQDISANQVGHFWLSEIDDSTASNDLANESVRPELIINLVSTAEIYA